jgi:hypothetical protein
VSDSKLAFIEEEKT